jgi:hypothetical protein
MRWKRPGFLHVLELRVARLNETLDTFWASRGLKMPVISPPTKQNEGTPVCRGETAPTGGFPPAGVLDAAAAAEPIAQGAIAMRESVGDTLLETFETNVNSLNQLLAGLQPHDWETPCYHPWQVIPARQFLALQLQELTLHEWDIRSRLEPEATLAPAGFQAIMELIAEASTTGFLRWAFRPLDGTGAAVWP